MSMSEAAPIIEAAQQKASSSSFYSAMRLMPKAVPEILHEGTSPEYDANPLVYADVLREGSGPGARSKVRSTLAAQRACCGRHTAQHAPFSTSFPA